LLRHLQTLILAQSLKARGHAPAPTPAARHDCKGSSQRSLSSPWPWPSRPSTSLIRLMLQGVEARRGRPMTNERWRLGYYKSNAKPRPLSWGPGRIGERGLAAAAARPGAESDRLGQLAALLGIIGRDHWIVGRKIPALAILLGRHVIGRAQMAL